MVETKSFVLLNVVAAAARSGLLWIAVGSVDNLWGTVESSTHRQVHGAQLTVSWASAEADFGKLKSASRVVLKSL